jgi:hypothetical protein
MTPEVGQKSARREMAHHLLLLAPFLGEYTQVRAAVYATSAARGSGHNCNVRSRCGFGSDDVAYTAPLQIVVTHIRYPLRIDTQDAQSPKRQ